MALHNKPYKYKERNSRSTNPKGHIFSKGYPQKNKFYKGNKTRK